MHGVRVAAVGEYVVVGAAGVLKCIRQNRHPVEGAVVVDAARQRQREHVSRKPCGIERRRAERVPEDVADEGGLRGALGCGAVVLVVVLVLKAIFG